MPLENIGTLCIYIYITGHFEIVGIIIFVNVLTVTIFSVF